MAFLSKTRTFLSDPKRLNCSVNTTATPLSYFHHLASNLKCVGGGNMMRLIHQQRDSSLSAEAI